MWPLHFQPLVWCGNTITKVSLHDPKVAKMPIQQKGSSSLNNYRKEFCYAYNNLLWVKLIANKKLWNHDNQKAFVNYSNKT